jgi:hypothetical protein
VRQRITTNNNKRIQESLTANIWGCLQAALDGPAGVPTVLSRIVMATKRSLVFVPTFFKRGWVL